jgi:hypothetical protein
MNSNEWKRILSNWEKSMKKNEIMKQKKKITDAKLSDIYMEALCDSFKDFFLSDDETKEMLDLIEFELTSVRTYNELVSSFARKMIQYSLYLLLFEEEEKYELCSKLKTTIELEVLDIRRVILVHFPHDYDVEIENMLIAAPIIAREEARNSYEIFKRVRYGK